MNRRLITAVLFVLVVLLMSALSLSAPDRASAFCNDWELFGVDLHCDGDGHQNVTSYVNFLSPGIYSDILDELSEQDRGDAEGRDEIHFDSCRFQEAAAYIRSQYDLAISHLNPAAPENFDATDEFGKLLHPVQDFYAHSNWVEMHAGTSPDPSELIDRNTGPYRDLDPMSPVGGDIIVGEIPPSGLPAGWSVELGDYSAIPTYTSPTGARYRGLLTGWNADGACPDVREGLISDVFGTNRTRRLVHGGGSDDRPCGTDFPTYVCLNKDEAGRPGYGDAVSLAGWQTQMEWCRLLHLARQSAYGYGAASMLMTLWANADLPPLPLATPCSSGAPGPVEVTVTPHVELLSPRPGSLFPTNLVFSLYTGDFRRALYSFPDRFVQDDAGPVPAAKGPTALTLCVRTEDTVVATVWGWDEPVINPPLFGLHTRAYDAVDALLNGVTQTLAAPGFGAGSHEQTTSRMRVTFDVAIDQSDADGDGLSSCAESFYGTSATDPDSDDDGLSDGAEVNTYSTNPTVADTDGDGLSDGVEVNTYGTDPNRADSDADGLSDGAEVATHHTDPLDPDSDDDGLSDGAEVTTHGTNPLDPDSDDDGLRDGQEITYGTNPLDADSDDDGLPDGSDVEFLESAVQAVPASAFRSTGRGTRTAILAILDDAESSLAAGDVKGGLEKLETLRRHVDGCGSDPDSNDWILVCPDQVAIRALVDQLVANVGA